MGVEVARLVFFRIYFGNTDLSGFFKHTLCITQISKLTGISFKPCVFVLSFDVKNQLLIIFYVKDFRISMSSINFLYGSAEFFPHGWISCKCWFDET